MRFCKNHPYVRATTRCYYCKDDICRECIKHLGHHYFCSQKCYLLSMFSNVLENVKAQRSNIILIWNIVLSIAVIGIIFFGTNSRNEGESVRDRTSRLDEIQTISNLLYNFKIDSLVSGGKKIRSAILNNKEYDVHIPLEKGSIINIWKNDWPLVSQTILKSGNHRFPIQLDYGKNDLRLAVWDARQKLVFGDRYEIVYKNPVVDILRHPVERGSAEYPRLSLTFDGGANASGANEILDALETRHIKTTIFLTGQFILSFPDLVRRMTKANHEIANHTFNHPHLTTYQKDGKHNLLENVNRDFVQRQLLSTDSVFFSLTGEHLAPFWRAPFGEYNQQILDWAAECGYMHVRWTKGYDSFDWVEDQNSPIYRSSQEVFEHIIDNDNNGGNLNGAIVLMHLGSNRTQDSVYKIVPDLIDEFLSRGYTLVPISELINP
jgi:peptidoglycan/xylan/chitin deacetylase (PgdA/CDA1 family)